MLDSFQLAFTRGEWVRSILHAGPGAGKTTTVCNLAYDTMISNPDSRILFITFTKAGVSAIEEKMGILDIFCNNFVQSYHDMSKNYPGIYITTFNAYGQHREYYDKLSYREVDEEKSITYESLDDLCESENPEPSKRTYDESLALHSAFGLQTWENWDLLIVDECQDILPKHETIINQIESLGKRVAYAGDPRQAIYHGATFFNKLCNSNELPIYYLEYNYRSSPEIVNLLNYYSRAIFVDNNIHRDQKAFNESQNIDISVKYNKYNSCKEIADNLCSETYLDSYIICPKTYNKFGFGDRIDKIRQYCFNKGRHCTIKNNCNSNKYIKIGNPNSLKGLESSLVVVYLGFMPDYGKFVDVSQYEMACHMYVALSRARNKLHIIADKISKPKNNPYTNPIFNYRNIETEHPPFDNKFLKDIGVVDHIVKRCDFVPNTEVVHILDPILPFSDLHMDTISDVIGTYMEFKLAKSMGVPSPCGIIIVDFNNMPEYKKLKEKEERKEFKDVIKKCRFFINDNNEFIAIAFSKDEKKIWEGWVKEHGIHSYELLHIKMKYSESIKKHWTVSDDLTQINSDMLNPYSELLNPGIKKMRKSSLDIYASRSRKILGKCHYEVDIFTEDEVIEVKYAVPSQGHILQTSIYSSLTGKDGILVNIKTGEITKVEALEDINLWLRASLAFIQISYFKNKFDIEKRFLIPRSPVTVFVSFSIHNNNIIEFGAIAINTINNSIINVISESCGCNCSEGSFDFEKYGFIGPYADPMPCGEQCFLMDILNDWLNSLSVIGSFTIITRSAHEEEYIDLSQLHNNFEITSIQRILNFIELENIENWIENKLLDDKDSLFVRDRAFEELMITMSTYNVITKCCD